MRMILLFQMKARAIVEARTVDKLDNISEISSKTVKIDKTLSEITLLKMVAIGQSHMQREIVVTDNKSV